MKHFDPLPEAMSTSLTVFNHPKNHSILDAGFLQTQTSIPLDSLDQLTYKQPLELQSQRSPNTLLGGVAHNFVFSCKSLNRYERFRR